MNKGIKSTIVTAVILVIGILLGITGIQYIADDNGVIATPTTGVNIEITSGAIEDIVNSVFEMIEASTNSGVEALVEEVVEEVPVVVAPVEYFIPVEAEVVEEVSTVNYYNNVETQSTWSLQDNVSRNVFRNLTGVSFMNELNATMVKLPELATQANLTITLGKEGIGMQNAMHTWNVTVGYESCKVDEILDRDNFPITKTIDLANVNCKNRGVKNFLPLLKDGVRVAIYHAQLDGTTMDGIITSN